MKTFSGAKQIKSVEIQIFIKVALLGPKLIPKARNVCMDFMRRPGLCPSPVCILQPERMVGCLGVRGGGNKLIFLQVFSALNLLNKTT